MYWDSREEKAAREVGDYVRDKIQSTGGEGGKMIITDWLPSRGGGKGSNTPGFGAKYVKNKRVFGSEEKVQHPGGRAFKVMEATKEAVEGKMDEFIDEVLDSMLGGKFRVR